MNALVPWSGLLSLAQMSWNLKQMLMNCQEPGSAWAIELRWTIRSCVNGLKTWWRRKGRPGVMSRELGWPNSSFNWTDQGSSQNHAHPSKYESWICSSSRWVIDHICFSIFCAHSTQSWYSRELTIRQWRPLYISPICGQNCQAYDLSCHTWSSCLASQPLIPWIPWTLRLFSEWFLISSGFLPSCVSRHNECFSLATSHWQWIMNLTVNLRMCLFGSPTFDHQNRNIIIG